MKILITGGAGFLGHHLVEHFLKNPLGDGDPVDIVVLDKLTYASSGLDRLREVVQSFGDVKVLNCDLAQPIPDGIKQEIGDVDYIIHAAAESHVDNSIRDPMPFLSSNVIGTHHLLWYAREMMARTRRLCRVLCVSTDEVYGPASWDHPGNVPTDPFRPANPYAAAKAGGECVAMAYANTYKIPITIVNTMNLIGERQHPEKFVPLVIRKALIGATVMIHADPTKTISGTRCYIHCRNYASALKFLIEQDLNGRDLPLKLHVAGESEISNLDLAQKIVAAVNSKLGKEIELNYELVDFHSSRPGHDLRYALNGDEIRRMGWKQPVDIDESLKRCVHWYLDNLRWLGARKTADDSFELVEKETHV